MGKIRAVSQTGRQCRFCRRKGGFRTAYCVHGTGSPLVEGIGHLFDPLGLASSGREAILDLESHRSASPSKVVHRSQVRRVVSNLLAVRVGLGG